MAARNSRGLPRHRSSATAADHAEDVRNTTTTGVSQISEQTTRAASQTTGVSSVVSDPASRSSAAPTSGRDVQGVLAKQDSFTAVNQDGVSTVQTEQQREDLELLSTSFQRSNKGSGRKGKGKRTKDGRKHKGSYGRDQQSHDGCDQEIRKRTLKAASNIVSAVQERGGEVSPPASSNRPLPHGSRDCAEEEVLYYSQGSQRCLHLPVESGMEVTDYYTDDANIAKGWSKKKHRHASKHKHKKRRSIPDGTVPSADTGLETEVTGSGVTGTERGSQLLSSALQTTTKETVSTASKSNGGAIRNDVAATTDSAILTQNEALFPDVADKKTLKREEAERRKRILSQRSSTISRDFFLWGNEDMADDPLYRRTVHVDELAGVSPEFSHVASRRKQLLLRHRCRNRAGVLSCDSMSVSSRSEFHGSPEASEAQSPVKESVDELKLLTRDSNEPDILPRQSGYDPVGGSMLESTSATVEQLQKPKKHSSGSMAKQVLAGPSGSGTSAVSGAREKKELRKGKSLEDTSQPKAPAIAVIERGEENRTIHNPATRKRSNTGSGASNDAHSFSFKQRPPDSNSLSGESQKAVSGIQSKNDDESSAPSSFVFVPDLDRKPSEQSDMSWTPPYSSAAPRIGKLSSVPTCATSMFVYSKALPDNSSNHPADAAALFGAVSCRSTAGSEISLHTPEKALVRVPYGTTSQLQGCGCVSFRCPDHATSVGESECLQKPSPSSAQLAPKEGVTSAPSSSDVLCIESENIASSGPPVKIHETAKSNLDGEAAPTRPECTKEINTTGLASSGQTTSPGISSSRYDPSPRADEAAPTRPECTKGINTTGFASSGQTTSPDISSSRHDSSPRTDLNASCSAVLVEPLLRADDGAVEYKVGECEITRQSGSRVNPFTSRASRECTDAEALETEVKLMMGLRTKKLALKPDISMDVFHALTEGQGCVTLDGGAPNDKEEMWREIDVVEHQACATLVRPKGNPGSKNDEVGTVRSDTEHEYLTSLTDRKRQSRVRQPVDSTSATSGTAHAPSVQAKQDTPAEHSEAAQKREPLTNCSGSRQDAPQLNDRKDSSKRQRRASEGAARSARRSSLVGHDKKSPSARRRSLDHGRDSTLSPALPSAASQPSEDRVSVETADLYPVKTQRWKSRTCLWRELSAVMARPVSIGVSAPGLNEIVLDEDEAPDEPSVLPVCTQVPLQDLEFSGEKMPTSSSIKRNIIPDMALLASRSQC